MKVLLLRPPIYSRSLEFPAGPRFGAPTSLLYLASVLEANGHEVVIYDSLIDFDLTKVSPDKAGIYHIGAPWSRLAATAAEHQPDVVGITNPFSDFAAYAIRAAEAVRSKLPEVPIIVGGPHGTSSPQTFLYDGSPVNYVIRGEGERSVIALLAALGGAGKPKEVAGLSYRGAGSPASNPMPPFIDDLDELPLPAYHLVDMERYFAIVRQGFPSRLSFEYPGSDREVSLFTSRGCPFKCTFCGNHLHMGRKWRWHSVDYLLRHMQHLIETYGIRHFHIEDDNVTLRPERFEQLLDGILERGWNMTWDTPNGVRPDRLTPQLLKKARATGCTYLVMGVESGNQEVLDTIVKKNLKLDRVVESVVTVHRVGLDLHAFYIVGFPGETRRQIEETFALAHRLLSRWGVVPHLGLVRPLPGTELFEISSKMGFLTEPVNPDIGQVRGENFERQMIRTPEFSPEDLEKWVTRFNRRAARSLAIGIFLWCLRHPVAWLRILGMVWRRRSLGPLRALKDVFFRVLIFKQNLVDPQMVKRLRSRV